MTANDHHDTDRHTDPTDTGTHLRLPEPPAHTITVACAGCHGNGHVTLPINPILRESLAALPNPDALAVAFYERLFNLAPELATLFPPDLLTGQAGLDGKSAGVAQREKLVAALAAVAEGYGGNPDETAQLDRVLAQAGRSHAAFHRPGEPAPRGASIAEYLTVKQALFETLIDQAGDRWRPEYATAWNEAYDYAMILMLHAQVTDGRYMQTPRLPRQARA